MRKSAYLWAAALTVAAAAAPARPCDETAETLAARRGELSSVTDPAELAQKRFSLGLWARDKGLEEAAREEFRAALAADPEHEAAHEALGEVRAPEGGWIGLDEAMRRKGLVLHDGAWILREEAEALALPARERERRRAEQRRVAELLARYAAGPELARKLSREALAAVDDGAKLEPLAYSLRSPSAALRAFAAEELGRLRNRRALRPLLHRAVHDPAEAVRHASIDAAVAIGDENLIAPLVAALDSDDADVRIRAADALGRAGDRRAVTYLVWKFEAHGGGGPRAFSFFGSQLTFIQDFDVEVASTAFIADPQPGTIQEGTVLDVQVVATSQEKVFVEREVVHSALQRLTGATSVPKERGAWAKWLEANRDTLVAAR